MNPLPTNGSDIPLHCNICSKKPDFSDVSHLLTHVASKGHLSAYYKMKVRGSTDKLAKQIIDEYDEWYEDFNLEELMRERMNQKEKKKRGVGVNTRKVSAANTTSGSGRSTPSTSSSRGPRPSRLRDNMHLLDPRLGHRGRSQPLSRSVTPQPLYSMDATGFQRALQHGMAAWIPNGHLHGHSPLIKQESLDSSPSDDDVEDEDDDTSECVPTRKSQRRGRHHTSVSMGSFDDACMDDLANDSTKLKGVYWPGMDMFDSATPEARRQRNQKKNISVLRSLQATSEIVQPTECVFDAEGVLRKQREITGNPDSEDSLIEGESEPEPESPKKKRAPHRSRPALAEKDVNTRRVLRNRGRSHHPPFGHKVKKPYFKEEDDDDLTYGPRPKKRSGFSIHRDNTGPDITFDQPAPMNYLTSGFQSPFQPAVMQPHQACHHTLIPRDHSREQSWGQLNGGFRSTSGMSNQTFPQFPQYLSNTLGQANQSAFPDLAGTGSHMLQNSQPMFQPQLGTAWDIFGFENGDFGMLGNTGNPFQLNGEVATANPLFLGVGKEDDEATISAGDDDY